jgi:hypothetical protein
VRGKERSPLVAAWQYGLGRTAIFAADPDSMATLSWVHWNRYAQFWSQLVTWAMRQGEAGAFDLRIISESGGGIRFEAEKADLATTDNLVCRVTGAGQRFDVPMSATGDAVFEGESASIPPGKYSLALIRKSGTGEALILSRQFAVPSAPAADADELRIRPANVEMLRRIAAETGGGFNRSPAQILRRTGATVTVWNSAEPFLIPLAIALVLAEVFVRRRIIAE